MELTNQQQMIVSQEPATMAVYAAPGSGKTTVLTTHIIELLRNRVLSPKEIWALTFTRKAALELRQRLQRADGIRPETAEALQASTFHARMFALLLAHNPAIPRVMDAKQQRQFLALAGQAEGFSPTAHNLHKWQQLTAYAAVDRTARLTAAEARIIRRYQRYKYKSQVWDYEDILVYARDMLCNRHARVLVPQGISYILVDEYQDTNGIQFDILNRIVTETGARLFVVGDDDQAIYGFRGGTPIYLTRFSDFVPGAKQFELTVNFRAAEKLLQPAWKLIRSNRQRHPKTFAALKSGGHRVNIRFASSDQEEAMHVGEDIARNFRIDPTQSIAVLARTRRQLWFLQPYVRKLNGRFTVSTFHEAKGREWDTVIISGAVEDHPDWPVSDSEVFDRDPEEERRLFYVAMTRARKRLLIHVPARIRGQRVEPSRFLYEAGIIRP